MNQSLPRLVGMVHLLPLPGSPRFGGSMDQVIEVAVSDAATLVEAGFPALMVENFGDVPFYADDVPSETVAAMTVAVREVTATGHPVGVNVLRNDGLSALSVAAATGAQFIRINVLSGVMYTDQGPIVGRAAQVQRKRRQLCPDVEVWADVMVKHATPPAGLDIAQATTDLLERGLADAIVVSGSGTGSEPDRTRLKEVRSTVGGDVRVAVGSGASEDNLDTLCEFADTMIVGSAVKAGGVASNRPDPHRATRFVKAAEERGLL